MSERTLPEQKVVETLPQAVHYLGDMTASHSRLSQMISENGATELTELPYSSFYTKYANVIKTGIYFPRTEQNEWSHADETVISAQLTVMQISLLQNAFRYGTV